MPFWSSLGSFFAIYRDQNFRQLGQFVALGPAEIVLFAFAENGDQEDRQIIAGEKRYNPIATALALSTTGNPKLPTTAGFLHQCANLRIGGDQIYDVLELRSFEP